jgi:acyl carrier protein
MTDRERILRVVSRILRVPIDSIGDDTSPEKVESWDSMKHMSLILALEQEFGIRFSDERIVELLNVKLIAEAVGELKAQADSDSQR